jgi:hypothetical protein
MVASLNRCYVVVVRRGDCNDIVAIVIGNSTPRRQAGKRMNAAGSVHWRNSAFEMPPPGLADGRLRLSALQREPCYPGAVLAEA